jgi:cytochrome c oxidase accessory protein FixG
MKDPAHLYEEEDTFRDRLATVDTSGRRIWIFPKKPSGRFYNARTVVSWVLLAVLFVMPFIRVNEEPLMLFNVLEGKFILLGIIFTAQDFHLFALAMVTLMIFIVLFTVVFGRIFCGWVCPQTIFMEMVFRKIEYLIEGDANQQRKLNSMPWSAEKWLKKGLKHLIFFCIAVVIANLFLSYIIGAEAVLEIIKEPVEQHLVGFMSMLVFSGLFYGVFAFMREQVCTTICPYGRMQGVLLVPDSIVVHYDFVRGEPRAKLTRQNPVAAIQADIVNGQQRTGSIAQDPIRLQGDCIDCKLCVQVCPTGIDIRNGTQLECVNCTACMDACDNVMDKIKRPRGLIRYDSYNGIKRGRRNIFGTRAIAYSAVLLTLVTLQAFLLTNRSEVETLVLKSPGQLFQKLDDGYLRNIYSWEVVNKTARDIEYLEFRVVKPHGVRVTLVGAGSNIVSPKHGLAKGVMMIDFPASSMKSTKESLLIEIWSRGNKIDQTKTNFLGPIKG